jgi:hypothetical protein
MKLKNILLALLTSLVISLFIVGCSDDKAEKNSKKTEEVFNPFDHSKDEKISKSEKEEFEKAFAAQCVKRETTANPNADKDRTEQSCTCVATYLMKDLTAKEAEKFVTEHENPVSLTFKFENAAYHCLQQKTPPKDAGFTPVAPK